MWMLAREEELLPVAYFHVVFTIPHELNDLCRYDPQAMYNLLFDSAWATLCQFGKDKRWLGAQMGATMILHTWGQNLSLHPHVHCIVPAGGVKDDGTWQNPKKSGDKFLFPVAAMKGVYKAIFMKGLRAGIENGTLNLPPDFPKDKPAYKAWRKAVYDKEWVIYAKRPFGGPQQVIEYLGRYTHKVAISNQRLKSFEQGQVIFEYKDYADGGQKKEMPLTVHDFVQRFAQHILPPKFRRIRHYGFLSNGVKTKALAKARQSLGLQVQKRLDRAARKQEAIRRLLGQNPNLCPCCKQGTMQRIGSLPRVRSPPIPGQELTAAIWLS
jgi:hypothetical protein